ncbi:MAG: hypothetical protein Kow002_09330 [Anaerolineales bacterium]
MYSPEKDKAFLEAGFPELKEYLLSKELFWPLTARGFQLPRLTIGGFLLAMARLEAAGERSDPLAAKLDGVRARWRVAWETKAGHEVRARSGLWRNYLEDYRQNPYQHADAYPYEVRNRVMLYLLVSELPESPPEAELVAGLDVLLKRSLLPGEFIWEAELQKGFPQDEFWFLYGTLKS